MVRHLAVLVVAAVFTVSATVGAAPLSSPDDIVQIYQVQTTFDRAVSTKNLDLMMSLWYDYATLSVGDFSGYEGKAQIRDWFVRSAAFKPQNHWVSPTASPRIRIDIRGDGASLYFESHYADVATKELRTEATVTATLARIQGRWLIIDAVFGPAGL